MQDTLDLKDEALLKASGALTGGIGGLADTCGSMIGSTLVLGSVCGLGRKDGDTGIPKLIDSIQQAADFFKWFKEKTGSVNCREIVTRFGNGVFYDYGIPEQALAAEKAGVTGKCIGLVQDNCTKVAGILWDELHKRKKHA